MPLNRRTLLAAGALAPLGPGPALADAPLLARRIPSTGEMVPAIGIGTSRRYEVEPTPEKIAPLRAAVERFVRLGGRVIDTAPSYGTAEDVLGMILPEGNFRDQVFLATKVSESGAAAKAQIERSFQRLRTDKIDLIAVHNLVDVDANLALLRDLKQAGRIRYVGITVWRDGQLDALEAVMRREALDFIQVNYAIDNRESAQRILPLARERGMAAMTNVPFGRDRLFSAVKGKPLPDWASPFCENWAQFFLKYVLADEAVTCPIPGMAKVAYVEEDVGAARGRLPDASERKRMEAFIDAV